MPELGSFARRAYQAEELDDFSISDDRLERALREISRVNRYLGGYRALRREFDPVLRAWSGGTLNVLDVGAGLGDHAAEMVRCARRRGIRMHVTAVDANPATVEIARAYLGERMSSDRRASVDVVHGDARRLSFADGAFHLATASLVLHHFDDDGAVDLLRRMARMTSIGLVVNDLHRHVLAYAGIRALATLLPVSSVFRHDGPLSVRRAFTPSELADLARRAHLTNARIRRRWAFRLTLSTVAAPNGEAL